MPQYKINYDSPFIDVYEKNLHIRRLIKNEVFIIDKDDAKLKVKITHIKKNNQWSNEIFVNVKVSGTINTFWNNPRNINSSYFRSTISRNREIRNKINWEIKRFFKMFGMPTYNIDIKKVMVCDNV